MAKCDTHPLDVPVTEIQISGSLKVNDILITIAASCSVSAWALSLYLIARHLANYTVPAQQKLIIRILLMVPVYTTACVFSIVYYKQHVYLAAIYEFYEALVIASFFLLLCGYLNPERDALRSVFAALTPQPWLHPVRFLRKWVWRKRTANTEDGAKWLSIIWAAIFQFVVVKFLGALTKCITEGLDVYCKELGGASHAKVWVQVIEILSLVTAMFCLLQFYSQCHEALAEHNPLLKFVAVKLVVFLFYVQSFILDRLTTKGGPWKPTDAISYPSLVVGIPNTLLCFEMAAVSILHLWAYPWHIYHKDVQRPLFPDNTSLTGDSADPKSEALHWCRAVLQVLNFTDVLQDIAEGFVGLRKRREEKVQDTYELSVVERGAEYHGGYESAKASTLSK
ncbi:organic solute transporter Ostalpha-domain-containing protein [Boeremia exigua]|uniref:organic solute transporter Ostalpha-domain-containing protein n=1 Tax=Boeremia exigua TaxID=749465 RepID=UPI001E8EE8C2|nr:organic solute transporter Ostalpha-domain-containing protein [Boeremia exigua]KAH6639858.1 organic solute transporter Ostalpha-domain-containing protein [Boeremia exigua]